MDTGMQLSPKWMPCNVTHSQTNR